MAMVSITELLSRQLSRNDDNHPNRFSLAIQDDWIALFPRYDVFSIQASSSLICYYALGSPSFGLKDWGDLVILRFRLCRNTLQDRNLPTSNFAKRNPLSFERCNQYPRDSRVLAACVSVSVPVKTYSKHPYTFAWKNVVDEESSWLFIHPRSTICIPNPRSLSKNHLLTPVTGNPWKLAERPRTITHVTMTYSRQPAQYTSRKCKRQRPRGTTARYDLIPVVLDGLEAAPTSFIYATTHSYRNYQWRLLRHCLRLSPRWDRSSTPLSVVILSTKLPVIVLSKVLQA
uniref:Uncharacterized protein n=1 Tax=Moniliophthora roreri TaxID=221103 RepID=A0A0W0FLX7_MONRR